MIAWLAVAAAIEPPVVGGQPAPPGSWPDAAAVFNAVGERCSGTLIAPRWVLTAAHCLPGVSHVVLDAAAGLEHGVRYDVVAEHAHDEPTATYDVALLQLDRPAHVTPRQLLRGCLRDFYADGVQVIAAGFGRVDLAAQEPTDRLHTVTVPIVDAGCEQTARGCRPLVSPGGELIAGGAGLDSCAGDSGGPLYLQLGDDAYLAGSVARSALPYDTPCGDGGIYVRADAIDPWVVATTGLLDARPTCDGLNRPARVRVDTLRVTQGQSAALPLWIDDPDPDDVHSVTVVQGPVRGRIDGERFVAEPFQLGREHVLLHVRDDGEPSYGVTVPLTIEVVPAGLDAPDTAAGCASPGRPASATGWGLLLGLAATRRRQKPASTSQTKPAASSARC